MAAPLPRTRSALYREKVSVPATFTGSVVAPVGLGGVRQLTGVVPHTSPRPSRWLRVRRGTAGGAVTVPGMDWTTIIVAGIVAASSLGGVFLAQFFQRGERRAREAREDAARLGPSLAMTRDTIFRADPDRILALSNNGHRDSAMLELAEVKKDLGEAGRAMQQVMLMDPKPAVRAQAAETQNAIGVFFNALSGAAVLDPWSDDAGTYSQFLDSLRRRREEAFASVETLAAIARPASESPHRLRRLDFWKPKRSS